MYGKLMGDIFWQLIGTIEGGFVVQCFSVKYSLEIIKYLCHLKLFFDKVLFI